MIDEERIVRREVTEVHEDQSYPGEKKQLFRIYQLIYYILWILEVLLAFRFFLRLFSANPANGFVNFIYSVTSPFVAPFRGIFPTPAVGGATFEGYTLLAMAVYAALFYALIRLSESQQRVKKNM